MHHKYDCNVVKQYPEMGAVECANHTGVYLYYMLMTPGEWIGSWNEIPLSYMNGRRQVNAPGRP